MYSAIHVLAKPERFCFFLKTLKKKLGLERVRPMCKLVEPFLDHGSSIRKRAWLQTTIYKQCIVYTCSQKRFTRIEHDSLWSQVNICIGCLRSSYWRKLLCDDLYMF